MYKKLAFLAVVVLTMGRVADRAAGADDPSLLGWWKLDEGAGDVAYDSSGRGVDGAINNLQGGMGLNGDAWIEDPERGIVLSFNGDDTAGTYVEAGQIPAMTLTNDFTWMVWCKQDQGGTGVNQTMLGNRYGGTAAPLQFIKFTPTKFEFYNEDTAYTDSITYPQPLPDGEWVHNAAVKKGTSLSYFRNGKKVASSTITKTIDVNPFYIGGDPQGERWRGSLSDVRIYERALSDEEIQRIGSQPKARKPDPADGAVGVGMPLVRWTPGDTAVLHNVYLGTSPDLTEADLKAARQPAALYYHVAGLAPGTTYYWRVDEIEKDGVTIHTGDVWSFVTQDVVSYYPNPQDAANDASPAPTLTWMPGAGATKCQVYLSDSLDAVTQGAAEADKGMFEINSTTFDPNTLEPLTTYYWRVDSVVGADVKTGPVWTFTTYLPIEDFESYTDDEGNRIYETWIDGWTNLTGSQVGYTEAPFAEQAIVHGGGQSMPLDYNNIDSPFYSEAERMFEPTQDWTVSDANTLVLYVRGKPGNAAAPLYVGLEDASEHVATVAHPDPAAVNMPKWTAWRIPLSDFAGVDPSSVKKMYLGVGDRDNPQAGGTGRLMIDDIFVTRPAPSQ